MFICLLDITSHNLETQRDCHMLSLDRQRGDVVLHLSMTVLSNSFLYFGPNKRKHASMVASSKTNNSFSKNCNMFDHLIERVSNVYSKIIVFNFRFMEIFSTLDAEISLIKSAILDRPFVYFLTTNNLNCKLFSKTSGMGVS